MTSLRQFQQVRAGGSLTRWQMLELLPTPKTLAFAAELLLAGATLRQQK